MLQDAIARGARIRVVYGPPGTGKTSELFAKASEAARRFGPRSVMVTSMTRAAAHEVRSRADGGDGGFVLPEQVGTLHSWARKALGDDAGEHVARHLSEWTKAHPDYPIRKGFFDDGGCPDVDDRVPEGERLLRELSIARARMQLDTLPHDVRAFANAWTEWKAANGYSDFDDWIEWARTYETSPPPGVRLIYVDEAQDHSPSELALVAHWAQACEAVVLLGDADQSIFSFRGADPAVFLCVPQEHKRTLEQSYRIPSTVHHVATRWIEQVSLREHLVYHPRDHVGKVERISDNFRTGCVTLARRARCHYEDGETCLFLAPSRSTLGPLTRALKGQGLPVGNPYAPHRGEFNPTRGLGRAQAFYAMREEVYGQGLRIWTWADLHRFLADVDAKHLEHGAKAFVKAMAKDDATAEKAVADTIEDAWATLDGFLGEGVTPVRTLEGLQALYPDGKKASLGYARAMERRNSDTALLEEPRVWVGTIHSVKGGQADHVYVSPDLGGFREQWEEGGRSGRDDLLRLYYVAFTRARQALYLCAPSRRYGRGAIQW